MSRQPPFQERPKLVPVVGEDPATVVLRWDGPQGGTMFQWDAWYAKLSRLTLDGAGRAENYVSTAAIHLDRLLEPLAGNSERISDS